MRGRRIARESMLADRHQLTYWSSTQGCPTGMLVEASSQVDYTSTTDFRAVIACLALIHLEAYYFSIPFKS